MDLLKYSFAALDKEIRACFESDYGPGEIPIDQRIKNFKAIVVPFGEFSVCGPCAAWSYYELAESEFPETYIVIGVNTMSSRNVVFSDSIKTPFGLVRGDKDLSAILVKNLDFLVKGENIRDVDCFDFQLPFLQFASKDRLKELRVLYLLVGDMTHSEIVNFSELLAECGKHVVLICSNNFIRYGEEFGYVPFRFNVKEELSVLNAKIYDGVIGMRSRELLDFVELKRLNVNVTPVVLCIEFAKCMGIKEGKLLREYSTSSMDDDYTKSINYASFVF